MTVLCVCRPPLRCRCECRCLDEVITVAAMLSADHVFSSASGLTGPPQGQGGPTDAARKLQDLAAQVRGGGAYTTRLPLADGLAVGQCACCPTGHCTVQAAARSRQSGSKPASGWFQSKLVPCWPHRLLPVRVGLTGSCQSVLAPQALASLRGGCRDGLLSLWCCLCCCVCRSRVTTCCCWRCTSCGLVLASARSLCGPTGWT
jgi:hypothetical protein